MATTIQSGRSSSPLLTADVASRAEVYGGRGLVFDGTSDYLSINDDGANGNGLFDNVNISVSFWTKIPTSGSSFPMYPLATFSGQIAQFVFTINSAVQLNIQNNNSTSPISNILTVETGIWEHWVATREPWSGQSNSDAHQFKVYRNGELIATRQQNSQWLLHKANLTIGRLGTSDSGYFNGSMCDMKIWTGYALSLSEVQEVYLKPEQSAPSASLSYLSAWYPMCEANPESPQSIVYDHSEKKLGSELVTNATDWTDSNSDGLADNWTDNYAGKLDYSIVTGSGFTGNAQRFEVNDVAATDRAIKTSATVFTSGTLYKVSFKYRASISSGSILVMDGGSGATVTNITTHTGDAKLFETYYVAPSGSHLWFYMQNADANAFMEIDEVSIKKVLMGNHATTNFFGDMSDLLSSAQKTAFGTLLDTDDNSFIFTNGGDITDTVTLSSELMNYNFADGTGVTVPSSLSSLTTFNGEMVINGGSVSSDYYSIADSTTWDVNKVYKIVVVCSAYTSGAITHQGGSASFGINFGVASETGTFTYYAVPYQNGSITLRSLSFVGTISSISIKEATTPKFFNLAGTDEITSNTLKLTNGGTTKAHVALPFTTEVGKSYVAEIKLITANMQGGLSVSDDLEENTLTAGLSNGVIITSNTFVATRTTSYVHIKNNQGNNNQYNLYDNLKVREVGISSSGFAIAQNEPVIPQIPLVKYNEKMLFDGIDDKVALGSTLTIASAGGQGSISAVVNISAIDSNFRMIFGGTHPNLFAYMGYYSNNFKWLIDGAWNTSSTSIVVGKTYHIIGTWNNTSYKFYVNGVLDWSITDSAMLADFHTIGDSPNYEEHHGIIDEVSVWNVELTSTQAQELFNDGVALDATTHSKSGNLLGYWRNDGVTTWQDRRGWSYLNFDGSNDKLENTSFTTHQTDTGTISGWFIFNDLDGTQRFLGVGGANAGDLTGTIRSLQVATASLSFIGYSADWDTTADLIVGNLYHLAITWNGDDIVVYVNGIGYSQTLSALVTPTGTNIRIGASVWQNQDNAHIKSISASVYTATLSESEVQSIYNNGHEVSEVGNNNIAHYWIMNNGSTVTDLVGDKNLTVNNATLNTGNDGTVNPTDGSVKSITIREGLTSGKDGLGFPLKNPSGNVLRLNGVNEITIIPKTSGLDMSGGKLFTMSCWFKASAVGVNHVLISSGDAGTAHHENSFYISSSNKLAWNNQDSDADFANSSGTTLAINTWYFATITFNGSTTVKIYLNDALDGTKSDCTNVAITYTDVYIGKRSDGLFFNGLIDEARIYNRELSLAEIQKNYKHQKGKHKND